MPDQCPSKCLSGNLKHIRKAQPLLAIEFSHYVKVSDWSGQGKPVVIASVAAVQGSAPRNGGAVMAITSDDFCGTIGGGQLEWLALQKARQMLAGGEQTASMDIPLGPEIGQCCGGRVRLELKSLTPELLAMLKRDGEAENVALPQVLIFGAGHTGKALAKALAPLPLKAMLIDSRPEAVAGFEHDGQSVISAVPESEVRIARPTSAFVVMTHSHSLDFLITAEALARKDAAYCGMIGSATKRAVFLSWLADNGYDPALAAGLTCPIGGSEVKDKRPQVIAAMTAAEILLALAGNQIDRA